MKKFPNWLDMPRELMVNILQRLRTAEIFISARKVCTTWRRICKDPALWKVINVHRFLDGKDADYRKLETLIKQAVILSCGELTDLTISELGDDDLLDYILRSSSKLKRLDLRESTICVTGSGLARAVKSVPGLEELYLHKTLIDAKDIEVIGRNCPQLKSFTLTKWVRGSVTNNDDHALAIANYMPELRHLELSDRDMTNNGLEAILNGCPLLEVLDLSMCYNIDLDGDLGKLCMERIKDFKFDPQSPEYEWSDNQECDCFDFDSLAHVDYYSNFNDIDEFYDSIYD